MLLQVDTSDARPLHEQVAAGIRGAVRRGELSRGDRLPSAKELAEALGINANTVLRALRALRDEGLLEFRRGRGVTVKGTLPQEVELMELLRRAVDVGQRCGYQRQELARMIEELT
ncbi:GntR family transcriptional regulator [Streptomyces sp. NBC_00076]|uniref:GntR family transcriptional regulator n=1 Tax=Streptomyces sp. NBC_00076 TaxID=2975642 RepID=UPI0032450CF5